MVRAYGGSKGCDAVGIVYSTGVNWVDDVEGRATGERYACCLWKLFGTDVVVAVARVTGLGRWGKSFTPKGDIGPVRSRV